MNLKRSISTVLLLSILSPNLALAQGVPSPDPEPKPKVDLPSPKLLPGEKDPGLAISPMKKGQRAPFTGVLLAPASVANVIVEMESFEERIKIEVRKATEQEKAECEKKLKNADAKSVADKKILQADIDDKARNISVLNGQVKNLKDELDSKWSPAVWAGIGGGAGIVLTILTAFAISKATK